MRIRHYLYFFLPLAVLACGLTGPRETTVSVQLDVREGYTTPAILRVAIEDASVELTTPHAQPNSGTIKAGFGTYPVRVALLSAARDTLGAVSFTETVQRDYRYGILAVVAKTRPVGFCLGDASVTPVRGSVGDTLFVFFGGLPDGAIC